MRLARKEEVEVNIGFKLEAVRQQVETAAVADMQHHLYECPDEPCPLCQKAAMLLTMNGYTEQA